MSNLRKTIILLCLVFNWHRGVPKLSPQYAFE